MGFFRFFSQEILNLNPQPQAVRTVFGEESLNPFFAFYKNIYFRSFCPDFLLFFLSVFNAA